MGKFFSHITWNERLIIETMLSDKQTVSQIAKRIKKTRQSVYNEISRTPKYTRLDSRTWKTEEHYSPDLAQDRYDDNLHSKGANLKIGNDHALAEYIEKLIVKEKYSPASALAKAREDASLNPGIGSTPT